MQTDLTVTNTLLGIMAFVSLLEALAVVGAAVAGFLVYRRVVKLIGEIEERHVAPAAARVNAILDDVKTTTSAVSRATGRLDGAAGWILSAIAQMWRRRPL